MWEIATQLLPWSELGGPFLLDRLLGLLKSCARPPLPAYCPADYAELVQRCWATGPSLRPPFDEILACDIFVAAAPLV